MRVLDTPRLTLRTVEFDDADFYVELVNDPLWIRYIGPRDIKTPEAAREAIRKGPMDMQHRLGFSLYVVQRKEDGARMGLCGLIKRDSLQDVDIGYALLPDYRGQGYVYEAASAVVDYARDNVGLKRLVAIISPDNESSAKVLGKLGFAWEQTFVFPGETRSTSLYGRQF
jgi:RimJ/RimL family protein N-acetyltransferase